MNHQMVFLKEGKGSIGYYNINPNPKHLLIFVHGFGGKSVDTWGDFPICVRHFQEFKYSDVIFYGYNSTNYPAIGSSELFYTHLKQFINPRKMIGEIDRCDTIKEYDRILFIGHSLGAIIIRRTLLDAKRDECAWLKISKIILFAPAHRGAHVHKLIFEGLPNTFRMIGSVAKYIYQTLNDLEENSSTIRDLIKDNDNYLKDPGNNNFTIATQIVSSVNDRIVLKNRFCEDPNPLPIEDRNHTTVCKPLLASYQQPLEVVLNNIK